MNIMYIGKFEKFYRTENYVAYALTKLGHPVTKVCLNRDVTQEKMRDLLTKNKIDMVLFSKPSRPWFKEFCEYCKLLEITTVTWVWDLFYEFPGNRAFPVQLNHCDHVFSTDGGHSINWVNDGVNHHVLRQGIHSADTSVYPSKYKYDIAFIGTTAGLFAYRERSRLIQFLQDNYRGRFVMHNNLRGTQLNRFLGQTKIVVGHSIDSPYYWSNRIYEILGRGGFFLHPKTRGLEEEFTDGEHYVSYDRNDYNDLREKIEYYLANDEPQERIRRGGHHKVKTHYTYLKRCSEMMTKIGSK